MYLMRRTFSAVALAVGVLFPHSLHPGHLRAQANPITAQQPLPPIPIVKHPVASAESLKRAYEFTARHEGVIRYVPCFCGCEAKGHESVESCFIAERTPSGGVEWSDHGAACGVCFDVVDAARQLTEEGKSPAEVRRLVIERFYRKRMTPTPEPPDGLARHVCSVRDQGF